MEKRAFSILSIISFVFASLVLPRVTSGSPRAQLIQLTCGTQLAQNTSTYVANFVASMENIAPLLDKQDYGLGIQGQGLYAFYGLAQCYGDLSPSDCKLCYAEARTVIPQCYPFDGAKMFLDGCFMRSQNYSFAQEYTGPEDRALCGNKTRRNPAFREIASRAVLQAASYASNNSGYARVEFPVSGNNKESAYVLANCWKTLSAKSCRACLKNASTSILGCLPWSEGRALNTGCFMRYSDTNFLNPLPINITPRESYFSGTRKVVIAAVVSSTLVVVVGAAIGAYIWKHKSIQKKTEGSYEVRQFAKTLRDSSLNFKYSILEKATGGFDEGNKIGHGGFGAVYKGVLPDGREIAIKRLFLNNMHKSDEFYNEINIISSIEHKNLVKLLGCSCSGPENLLVYEFVPNKSLDRFIYASDAGKSLNWVKRLEIIIDIAEGLVYLHENKQIRIIHRDIKASNILLDTRLRAKIADFGLVRAFQDDKSHISTAIAGTLGYLAPEYIFHGQLTEKADVYSFGVLVLEIIAGRPNNRRTGSEYSESLVTIVWQQFQQGTVQELIDENLMLHNYHNSTIINEIVRVIHIGLLCTQENPSLRPSTSKALEMLTKKDEHLPAPTRPPFMYENSMELNVTVENSSQPLNFGSVATVSQSIFLPR